MRLDVSEEKYKLKLIDLEMYTVPSVSKNVVMMKISLIFFVTFFCGISKDMNKVSSFNPRL